MMVVENQNSGLSALRCLVGCIARSPPRQKTTLSPVYVRSRSTREIWARIIVRNGPADQCPFYSLRPGEVYLFPSPFLHAQAPVFVILEAQASECPGVLEWAPDHTIDPSIKYNRVHATAVPEAHAEVSQSWMPQKISQETYRPQRQLVTIHSRPQDAFYYQTGPQMMGSQQFSIVPNLGVTIAKMSRQAVGAHYKRGGFGPEFDNLGIAVASHFQVGIHIPTTFPDLARFGAPIDKFDIRPGDILFFCRRGLTCPCDCAVSQGGVTVVSSLKEGWDVRMWHLDHCWVGNILCVRRYW